MKRAMAYVMLFINKLKQKQCSKVQEARLKENLLDVGKSRNAEKMIVKLVKGRYIWFRYQKYQEVLLE